MKRAEFSLIAAICFGYPIAASLYVLFSGPRRLELTTGHALSGIAFQLVAIALSFLVLRARGWTVERLGLRFSWTAAATGIPLFLLYLLLYFVTATIVLLVWPGAREALTMRYATSAPAGLLLGYILLDAFFQETAVTAYVVTALSREGAALAITASTLVRFACQLHQGPLAAVSLIPLGLLFGTMFWYRRNVWPLIVAHALANVVAFAMLPERSG